jgi:hypothetical protein
MYLMRELAVMNSQIVIKPREIQTRPLLNFEKMYTELEYLRSALVLNQQIAKDLKQPLLNILTLVELGQLENGLDQKDCNALHRAVSELQDLLQCLFISAEGTRQVNPVV